ncbi:MAG TPA: DNA polymerase III subunit beta [Patescibacteria group bacterium]
MTISVLQENLHAALQAVYKAVPSNPQLPILSSLCLNVTEQEMTLSATDLYLGITSAVPVKASEEIKKTVPAKVFFDIVHSLPAGKLELDLDESSLTIHSANSDTKIALASADEYPEFPEIQGQSLTFTRQQLEQITEWVAYSASTDQARLVLTSVSFAPRGETLEIVATDGFRLSLYSLKTEHSLTEPLLLGAKAIIEIVRIAKQLDQEQVEIMYSAADKQAVVKIGSTHIFIRLIEGDYPPYEKIMPATASITAAFEASEFVSQVKRALVVARDVSNIVTLEFTPEEMKILAQSSVSGTYQGTMPVISFTGEPITIAFNASYLLDYISHVKPHNVTLEMTEPLKPAVFKDADKPDLSYLVMPFRTNS